MPADCSITCRIDWQQEEADGSDCARCGDPIFLKAWRLMAYYSDKLFARATNMVCDSCKDVMQER